ncbi:MAG: 1-acyl-sn-glycerol-3-phosphate acyltransferase [Betaproteobacteria bacterium]|nr:1-acyl-sn-glycerol-3-phosphate acyltransferase [Betaproteobacteria bacterium]
MSAAARRPDPGSRVPFIVRWWRWARFLSHVAVAVFMVGLVFPRIGAVRRNRLTGWWAKKLLRIMGILLSPHGAIPEADARNVIIASNHVSWVDIFVISAAHPALFIAKSEIRDWPIAGFICERAGTIFIRRARRRDTAVINETMHKVLSGGYSVGFFPEGTTTPGDKLLKFHTSLFEPAVVNGAALSPVALRYRLDDGAPSPAIAFVGEISFVESVGLILSQRRMIAEITFAPPIAAGGLTRRELAVRAEAAVAAILDVPLPSTHQRFPLEGIPDSLFPVRLTG